MLFNTISRSHSVSLGGGEGEGGARGKRKSVRFFFWNELDTWITVN